MPKKKPLPEKKYWLDRISLSEAFRPSDKRATTPPLTGQSLARYSKKKKEGIPYCAATLLGKIYAEGLFFPCQDFYEVHLPSYFFTITARQRRQMHAFAVFVDTDDWMPDIAPKGTILALERKSTIVEGMPCLLNVGGNILLRRVFEIEARLPKSLRGKVRTFRLKSLDPDDTTEEIIRSDRLTNLGMVTSIWKSFVSDYSPEVRRLRRIFMRMSDDITPIASLAIKSCITSNRGWSYVAYDFPKVLNKCRAYADANGRITVLTPRLLFKDGETPVPANQYEARSTFNHLYHQATDIDFLSPADARRLIYRTLFSVGGDEASVEAGTS